MSPAIITLIAWSPFLLLALIFGTVFCLKGYKRGAARAGISIGVTIITCILSILISKLIAGALAGTFAPMLTDVLKNTGVKAGANELTSLATSLGSAVAALILFIPVFIILVSILKPVTSFIVKRFIPAPKHVANKIGGLSVSLIDALLLAMLITLPLYGTLALADGVIGIFADKDDEAIEMTSAATDPFIVDVANVPPFSTVYDSLMTCKMGGTSVSVSGTVRETTVVLRHAMSVGEMKKGSFNQKAVLALLDSAEKLLTKNEFVTDFICEYMDGNLPSVNIPGIGKIKLNEYYPSLSDSKQLRKDIPAFFDLTEAMVKSGMVEALVNKDTDMSKVNAEMVSKAFGNTLNHSTALATFKSNLLNTVVDSFSKEIIDEGKDKDGSVKALCDAIAAIPTTPMGKDDAKKEGESFYLLVSGLITSSNKKTQVMGLGMMLEGLARHPMVGVDKVVNASETIMKNSGADVSDSLIVKMKENLILSVNKPIGENSFGKYCNTAFVTVDAFTGIVSKPDGEEGEKESSNDSLKELITSDKESLEAVKDTVSEDLMVDMGIDNEHVDTFKGVIDATFDSIIESECTEEEAEKEAEALGNVLETVTEVIQNPDDANDIIKDTAAELIEECLESKVVSGMIQRLTNGGRTDPLKLFTTLTDDARDSVEETIDEYVIDAETEDEIAVLEAFKLFVGIKNDG